MNNNENDVGIGGPTRRTYSALELRALVESWQQEKGVNSEPDSRAGGLEKHALPEGASVVGFGELALDLATDPRGFVLLTGWEQGAAGLELFRVLDESSSDKRPASAMSFCVNGFTYTAFENPEDGYRSSMARMVKREGNWCKTSFEPCALVASFKRTLPETEVCETRYEQWSAGDPSAGQAEELSLLVPGKDSVVLTVGTDCSEDFYPCFLSHCSPKELTRASALGIALAHELDRDVELSDSASSRKSKPRL